MMMERERPQARRETEREERLKRRDRETDGKRVV
jgi:hypothetical protein